MILGSRRTAVVSCSLVSLGLTASLLVAGPAEARPRIRSEVTLRLNANSVILGDTVKLSGRVKPARSSTGRRTVKIQIRAKGSGDWRRLATVRASRSGAYAVRVTPPVAGHFKVRAVVKKSRALRSATSGKRELGVSLQPSAVAASWPGNAARRTSRPVVTGAVSTTGEPRTVYLQRQVPGTWTTLSSATTDATTGAYRLPIPTGILGRWQLRVLVAPTQSSAAGDSVKPGLFAITPDWAAGGRAGDHRLASASLFRWNPCSPIRYRVNDRRATAGALDDVKQALHRVTLATGLQFQYAGRTGLVPQQAAQDLGDAQLVIAWATSQQSTYLGGGRLGAGEASVVQGGYVDGAGVPVAVASQGKVVMNSARNGDVRPGSGAGPTRVAALMHELGHVVGLGHARERSQIMYADVTAGDDWWGNGDITGLRQLGTDQGCAYVPGTQP